MVSKFDLIGADIAEELTRIGFRFFRSDRVGLPEQPLTDRELKLFKALAQMYPYLEKHIPK